MKGIVLSIIIVSMNITAECQDRWHAGVGITYCSYVNNPGVNLNLTYRLLGMLHVGPDFSALLTSERNENGQRTKRKELEYNINAHYLYDLSSTLAFYPLGGVNFSKLTKHVEGEDPVTRHIIGINSGGGFEFRFRQCRVFIESKYTFRVSKSDVTAGVVMNLRSWKNMSN